MLINLEIWQNQLQLNNKLFKKELTPIWSQLFLRYPPNINFININTTTPGNPNNPN